MPNVSDAPFGSPVALPVPSNVNNNVINNLDNNPLDNVNNNVNDNPLNPHPRLAPIGAITIEVPFGDRCTEVITGGRGGWRTFAGLPTLRA